MDPDSDRDPDPDPGPALFIIDLQDADKKQLFWRYIYIILQNKSHKKVPER